MLGSPQGGVAHAFQDLAACGDGGVRRRFGVQGLDRDLIHGQIEHFGDDLGQGRVDTGEVHDSREQGRRAVVVELDHRSGGHAAHVPVAHRQASSPVGRGPGLVSLVAGKRQGGVQGLGGHDAIHRRAARAHVSVRHQVVAAEVDGIPSHFGSDAFHLRFDGEIHLRPARRAEGAAGWLVGVDAAGRDAQVGYVVGSLGKIGQSPGDQDPPVGIGATVEQDIQGARDQLGVVAHPGLDGDMKSGPRRSAEEILAARHHDAHRIAGFAGQGQRGHFVLHGDLAPEAASDFGRYQPHAIVGDRQRVGDHATQLKRGLGRGMHRK